MATGIAGASLRGPLERGEGFSQGRFYHHVWARVKGSEVSFTVKEIDGPDGKGRMFRAREWGDNGPLFDP